MSHSVLVKNSVAAADNRVYNRSVVTGSDPVDNGNVFGLAAQGTAGSALEVWTVVTPVTGSLDKLWMAASPEVPITVDGVLVYKGLNSDPRNFYNVGGTPFDAIKLVPGDIITLTVDAFDTAPSAFAVATTATGKFTAAAGHAAGVCTLRYLATTYISIGSGNIDNQRVNAYKMEVIEN
jgi:hypothetical protein